MSPFRICIVRADGEPVLLHPGRTGERYFVDDVVKRVLAKGVGIFRTEAHVREDLEAALEEALHDLKSDVVPALS